MSRWSPQDLANYQTKRGLRLEIVSAQPKPNKYRAKRTEVDGIVFDSKRESTRYQDLKAMQDLGLIHDLKLQVSYPLIVNGMKVATYRADFEYFAHGEKVTEDAKGVLTPVYKLKKKLMLALHGISIRET